MSAAFVALGSNLGHRAGNIRAALDRLDSGGAQVCRSSFLWETDPVPPGQPSFLNAAALISFDGDPFELLKLLKGVEHALGRRRSERWGPRPIDLDLLLFEQQQVAADELVVPHPRMFERSFILAPLLEVVDKDSELESQCLGKLSELGLEGVRRTTERAR